VIRAWRARLATAVLAMCSGCGDADQKAGAWEFKVDTVSSDGGGSVHQTSWLRVVGQEGAAGEPRKRAVILSFDCLPDDATTRIMTDQSLRQGSVESRLTLDADPPLRVPGFAGTTPTGGQMVLTIPQDSLLAALDGHQRAIIEYADGAGSSKTTAEFPLAGLETFRERFLASCAERR
jgi:hypothetical protein